LGSNKAFKDFIKFEEKNIVGCTDFDFFPKKIADILLDNDRKMLATGKAIRNEEWVTQRCFPRLWVSNNHP